MSDTAAPGTREGEGAFLHLHSVTLDPSLCVGCTTCLRTCPTEAIRVRKGRARIRDERCIDCGNCIRSCPHGAKKALSDPLSLIGDFRRRVALPAPSLYGQFEASLSMEALFEGLRGLGFDEVFEVAEAAALVSAETERLLAEGQLPRPLISSACPAVVRLVQVRFPSLIPQLAPVLPPFELAARIVKEILHPGEEGVGVFFLSPCAGKVTCSRLPLGYPRSAVDGVIGISELYLPLLRASGSAAKAAGAAGHSGVSAGRDAAGASAAMSAPGAGVPHGGTMGDAGSPAAPGAGTLAAGLRWGRAGGEAAALGGRGCVAVDGIANVAALFEELENGRLRGIDYIEALGCPAGCVGGPLTAVNPFLARSRIDLRARSARSLQAPARTPALGWTLPIEPRPILVLDRDIGKAMEMMAGMEAIVAGLPGLDCGSCGAPTCQALAEDIVRGTARETDCIFKLRENVRELAGKLLALEELRPPGLDKE